jgi:cytoskeletal protein RodZ
MIHDKNEKNENKSMPNEDRLGAYLRRAREAANLSQEELAKEIKLSQELLDHLEHGRFQKLPVQAYVRGYLNSICLRLELDKEKVLQWLSEEYNKSNTSSESFSRHFESLGDLQEEPMEKSPKSKVPLVILILLIAFMATLHFMQADDSDDISSDTPNQTANTSLDKQDGLIDTSSDSSLTDTNSSIDAEEERILDAVSQEEDMNDEEMESENKQTETNNPPSNRKSTVTYLKFKPLQDNAWIRIFRHGPGRKTWTRELPADNDYRTVVHDDTISVWVKEPKNWEFMINGTAQAFTQEVQILNGAILK